MALVHIQVTGGFFSTEVLNRKTDYEFPASFVIGPDP